MKVLRQLGDQVAEHVRGGREAVQQDDLRRIGVTGFAVEDVEAVDRKGAILQAIGKLERLPVTLTGTILARCRGRADALEAVLAARAAAVAVLSGEADKTPEDLANDQADRVRKEGWIYGVED